MKSMLLSGGFALLACCAASAAAAEGNEGQKNGFYMSFGAGVASVNKVNVEYYDAGGTFGGKATQDTASGNVRLKSALALRGAIGYDFGRLRTDVEVDYSRNSFKSLEIVSVNGSPVSLTASQRAEICSFLEANDCTASGNTITFSGGRVRQLSALVNGWFDIPVSKGVTPYVGGGIGVTGVESGGEGKARFAWQLGAGVGFNLSRNVVLSADYRRRQIARTSLSSDDGSGTRLGKVVTNSFTAGLRITF